MRFVTLKESGTLDGRGMSRKLVSDVTEPFDLAPAMVLIALLSLHLQASGILASWA